MHGYAFTVLFVLGVLAEINCTMIYLNNCDNGKMSQCPSIGKICSEYETYKTCENDAVSTCDSQIQNFVRGTTTEFKPHDCED